MWFMDLRCLVFRRRNADRSQAIISVIQRISASQILTRRGFCRTRRGPPLRFLSVLQLAVGLFERQLLVLGLKLLNPVDELLFR